MKKLIGFAGVGDGEVQVVLDKEILSTVATEVKAGRECYTLHMDIQELLRLVDWTSSTKSVRVEAEVES